jgi:hypothetical protein
MPDITNMPFKYSKKILFSIV